MDRAIDELEALLKAAGARVRLDFDAPHPRGRVLDDLEASARAGRARPEDVLALAAGLRAARAQREACVEALRKAPAPPPPVGLPVEVGLLDHLLLCALRYALPRTSSTGTPDEAVIAAWRLHLGRIDEGWLRQAVHECAWVDRQDAAAAGALPEAARARRQAFRLDVEAEIARRTARREEDRGR